MNDSARELRRHFERGPVHEYGRVYAGAPPPLSRPGALLPTTMDDPGALLPTTMGEPGALLPTDMGDPRMSHACIIPPEHAASTGAQRPSWSTLCNRGGQDRRASTACGAAPAPDSKVSHKKQSQEPGLIKPRGSTNPWRGPECDNPMSTPRHTNTYRHPQVSRQSNPS